MDISITSNDAISPDLRRKIASLQNTRPLMRAAGQAAVGAMKAHYKGLPPNERGWASKKFWVKQGAQKTQLASFDDRKAVVVVDSVQMGHKFFGGPVSPKRGTYLTIPLNAQAYKAGSPGNLMTASQIKARRKKGKRKAPQKFVKTFDGGEKFLFTKGPVTHKPDPRAFPPEEKVATAVLAKVEEKIDAIMRVS